MIPEHLTGFPSVPLSINLGMNILRHIMWLGGVFTLMHEDQALQWFLDLFVCRHPMTTCMKELAFLTSQTLRLSAVHLLPLQGISDWVVVTI